MTGLAIAVSVQAQKIKEQDVPAPVRQEFKRLYPNAALDKWEMEEGNLYEAEFKLGKEEKEALFDKEGKLVKTEVKLASIQDLPILVLERLKKEFPGYRYEEPEKAETADGKILYEVEAEKGNEEYELLFDDKGTLIEKKAEEKK